MKNVKIFVVCASVLILVPSSYPQHCYSRCNCNRKSLQINKCAQEITDLNIYLDTKEITIYCKQLISENVDNIITFDASYLSVIDDKSPLTLEAMIKKCFKTKERNIRYVIDFNKLRNISATNIIFDNKNTIKKLKIQGTSETHKGMNISIVGPQFGSNLETLVLNNITVLDLKSVSENIPKVKILDLTSNNIDNLPENAFGNLKKLYSLSLKGNKIKYLNQLMFEGSTNITSLDLSKNMIAGLENTPFCDLNELKNLNLSSNNLKIIEMDTFASMSQLEHLDLSKNSNLSLPENIFKELASLVTLNLSDCYIRYIPEKLLEKCHDLQILNMSRNEITKLETDTFQNLHLLTVLDISYNKLKILPTALLHPLKKLQYIYFGSNKLTTFSSEWFWSTNSLKIIEVNNNLISRFHNSLGRFHAYHINLKGNRISRFPAFLLSVVVNLKYLDLSNNIIPSIELVKDLIPRSCNMTIDLSNNIIKEVNITSMESISKAILNKNRNITLNLANNFLKCDCKFFKLEQASQKQENAMLQVKDQESICLSKEKNPQCSIIPIKNCPPKCMCYFQEIDTSIIVVCSYRNLTEFPKITNLQSMHHLYKHNQTIVTLKGNKLDNDGQERLIGYNNVTDLDLSSNGIYEIKFMPKKLVKLNLENNHLTTLSQEIVDALYKNVNLKWITLQDNPWICDCNADYLQKYLREYNNLKVDPSQVICKDTKEKLLHAEICKPSTSSLKVGLPVGLTTFLAFISVLLALYFKYSTNIKIYLYSKNLCLWFVEEEEIDKEKTYDVFISYSHKDETFVQNELLPELENGDASLKVCIHYRDWLPGEFISKQIISSVLDSRRTLVILSNNFMESVWGKMEFRTAHMQAINEGRARVIVVIYEDLDENTLDDEMKAYLKTNTYVKWGDPWFWSKLKYALPHSKSRSNNPHNHSLESFHLK